MHWAAITIPPIKYKYKVRRYRSDVTVAYDSSERVLIKINVMLVITWHFTVSKQSSDIPFNNLTDKS